MKDEKDPVEPGQNNTIHDLLKLERITPEDIVHLSKSDKKKLLTIIYVHLSQLVDEERDAYLEKVRAILDLPLKNRIWQRNNLLITQAIEEYKKQFGTAPDKSDIADRSGLSLTTVYKHFKSYRQNNMQLQLEQFEFMAPKVLDAIFNKSVGGNVNAAKLFFKVINNPPANGFGSSKVRIDDPE
jgi:hypothetical protein